MSLPKPPQPAKLVIGAFLKDKSVMEQIVRELVLEFGQIDMASSWLPFDFTDYYHKEMGGPLVRRMFSFKKLIDQKSLPEIKLFTNYLEKKVSEGFHSKGRMVNIDPGYLLLERFVLATGKNFTHRIYLSDGIYADLTLIYTKGRFKALPWTYPDYKAEPMTAWLTQVRERYKMDLKEKI